MSLIKCENCGNMISDKASSCPKCGHVATPAHNNPETPASHDPELSGKRSLKWLFMVLIVLIAGVALFFLYPKNITSVPQTLGTEQTQKDCGPSDKPDEAPCDTKGSDSHSCDFTSPDLSLFDLHGRVKSVRCLEGKMGLIPKMIFTDDSNIYTFTEDGTCRNPMRRTNDFFLGFEYDSQGRIVGSRFAENIPGAPSHTITWGDDSRISCEKVTDEAYSSETKHTYSNGEWAQARTIENFHIDGEDGGKTEREIYTIVERDSCGNWTKREVLIYTSNRHYVGNEEITDPLITTHRTDIRTIEYY